MEDFGLTQSRSAISDEITNVKIPYIRKVKDLHPIPTGGALYVITAAQALAKAIQNHPIACLMRYPDREPERFARWPEFFYPQICPPGRSPIPSTVGYSLPSFEEGRNNSRNRPGSRWHHAQHQDSHSQHRSY